MLESIRNIRIIVRLVSRTYLVTAVFVLSVAIFVSALYIAVGFGVLKASVDIVEGPIDVPKIVNRNALSIYTSRIPAIILEPLYNISSNAGFLASVTLASVNNTTLVVLGLDSRGYDALGLSKYKNKVIMGSELSKRLGIAAPGKILLINGLIAESHVLVRVNEILVLPGRLNEVLIVPLHLCQVIQQRPPSIVSVFYVLDEKVWSYINKVFVVRISLRGEGLLQVFSLDGKLVYNESVKESSVELSLPIGYYAIMYKGNNGFVSDKIISVFEDQKIEISNEGIQGLYRIILLGAGENYEIRVEDKLSSEKILNYIVLYVKREFAKIFVNDRARTVVVKADTIIAPEAVVSSIPRTCIQIKYWNGRPYTGIVEIEYKNDSYLLAISNGVLCSYIANYKLRVLSASGEMTFVFIRPQNKTIVIPPYSLISKVPVDLLLGYLSSRTFSESLIGLFGSGLVILFSSLIAYSTLIFPLPYILTDVLFRHVSDRLKKLVYLGVDNGKLSKLIASVVYIVMFFSIMSSFIILFVLSSFTRIDILLLVYELKIDYSEVLIIDLLVSSLYFIVMYRRVKTFKVMLY